MSPPHPHRGVVHLQFERHIMEKNERNVCKFSNSNKKRGHNYSSQVDIGFLILSENSKNLLQVQIGGYQTFPWISQAESCQPPNLRGWVLVLIQLFIFHTNILSQNSKQLMQVQIGGYQAFPWISQAESCQPPNLRRWVLVLIPVFILHINARFKFGVVHTLLGAPGDFTSLF